MGEEEAKRQKRADSLLDIISAQSPALIKAGQALASRSDLLPKEYLDTLQKLQDRCPSYPTEQAMAAFKEEFGVEFEEIYEMDTSVQQPVAAASIGQVYKAILRKNGQPVAVKIQRPNCEDAIAGAWQAKYCIALKRFNAYLALRSISKHYYANKVIKRLRSDIVAIVQWLQGDFAAISQRLRSDRVAISQRS
jgi:hypothetical protein